jgi:uncharacterized protein (UPF0332 family)
MDEQIEVQVRNRLKRADEYLRAAKLEFQGEFYARSISTAYYAMFYAATGALESIGIERAKHSGVISAFGEYFIIPGKIDREMGRMFNQAERDREEADYAALPTVDRVLAQKRLEEAQRFVQVVTDYLIEQGLKLE